MRKIKQKNGLDDDDEGTDNSWTTWPAGIHQRVSETIGKGEAGNGIILSIPAQDRK